MSTIRVTAKTLDEAIMKASIELGTTSDNLDYEIVEKGSAGLFGFIGAKSCVIEVKRKKSEEEMFEELSSGKKKIKEEPVKAAEKPVPKPTVKPVPKSEPKAAEKPDMKPLAVEEVKPAFSRKYAESTVYEASARNFLKQIFDAMKMEVDIQASFKESEKELTVTMAGADMGILIGKRGQTLDSLQYLVSLVVNKDCDGYVRVKLDTENYRERRKETLEILAKNIAYKVKRTRKSVSLEPMNPYERRIIHATLQSDKFVVTRSEGEDPFRHVVISLKRENRDNKDRRNQQDKNSQS